MATPRALAWCACALALVLSGSADATAVASREPPEATPAGRDHLEVSASGEAATALDLGSRGPTHSPLDHGLWSPAGGGRSESGGDGRDEVGVGVGSGVGEGSGGAEDLLAADAAASGDEGARADSSAEEADDADEVGGRSEDHLTRAATASGDRTSTAVSSGYGELGDDAGLDVDAVLDAFLALLRTGAEAAVAPRWEELQARLATIASGVLQTSDASATIRNNVQDILSRLDRTPDYQQSLLRLLDGQAVITGFAHLLNTLKEDHDVLKAGQTEARQLLADTQHISSRQGQLLAGQRTLQNQLTALQAGAASCPVGWSRWRDYCYLIGPYQASWFGAARACALLAPAARLASVHESSAQFVRQLIVDGGVQPVWVGLARTGGVPVWGWTDGSPLDRTAWRQGEPNNSGSRENCVEFCGTGECAGWNDRHCMAVSHFLCQIKLQ